MLELQDLVGLSGRISIDFETTGLDVYRDRSVGLGVWAEDAGVIGFLPTPDAQDIDRIREVMGTWKRGSWVMAHNLKFELALIRPDRTLLERFNWFDTQVAEHLLNEEGALSLEACELRRLRTTTKKGFLAESKQWGGIKKVADWPLRAVADYCINDCRITHKLAELQSPEMRRQRLDQLFKHSMEFVLNLYEIERLGLCVDIPAKDAMKRRIAELVKSGEEKLRAVLAEHGAGGDINYRSPKQLHDLLYNRLGIPWPEMPEELIGTSKADKYNQSRTSKFFLGAMDHPAAALILQLKNVQGIASYIKKYEQLGLVKGDLLELHPSFNPTGTVTGRLSSSNPNIQQVTNRIVGAELADDGQGLHLRKIFRARPGRVLVSMDYKQMEVVAFALLSKEPKLIRMVETGQDMHRQVSDMMFGEYDPKNRNIVKQLNFGLLYGLGIAGMAEQMGVDYDTAQALMARYMEHFNVRPWIADVGEQLRQRGYVRYWSGRKRRITQRKLFYRGVNALVQGGSADVLMVAANRCSDYLRSTGSGSIVALIHDEILFEMEPAQLDVDIPRLRELMGAKDLLGTAFNVDVEYSTFWATDVVTVA